ncbi:purine-binding chemotaxis protein CheW [bacterium]|nr:purine-binding chemotaxis protein CheW [candidate division CSSED10-310 bacterium]
MSIATENARTAEQASEIGRRLAGKYLTFLLGSEEYGLEILKVQEIIQMQKVTKVPNTPHFVRGIINLRGKVIPVIELRKKFDMEAQADTEKTCIIVVRIEVTSNQMVTMGIIIDDVKEVLDIHEDNIEETPSFGSDTSTDFIMGIGKVGQNVKMLLNIDKVLSNSEIQSISHIAKA